MSADSRSPPPGPRRSATLETLRAGIRDAHLNRTDERPPSGALHQHDDQRRPQRRPELVQRLTDAGVAHEVHSGVQGCSRDLDVERIELIADPFGESTAPTSSEGPRAELALAERAGAATTDPRRLTSREAETLLLAARCGQPAPLS